MKRGTKLNPGDRVRFIDPTKNKDVSIPGDAYAQHVMDDWNLSYEIPYEVIAVKDSLPVVRSIDPERPIKHVRGGTLYPEFRVDWEAIEFDPEFIDNKFNQIFGDQHL